MDAHRETPLRIRVHVAGAVAHPGGGQKAKANELLGKTDGQTADLGAADFCLIKWDNCGQKTNAEAQDESAGNEHAHVDGTGLDGTANGSNDASNLNGTLATDDIGKPHGGKRAKEAACLEKSDNGSRNFNRRVVKVFNKLRLDKNTANDARIITKQEAADG